MSAEPSATCRKPDELRLLRMTSGSNSTAAASTSSGKCPSSTGSCGTACTTVDGASNSSRVPRRVISNRGRGAAGGPAGGERGGGGGGGPVSRAKLKTVKLTAAVVLSYFICWSPYFISHLWSVWDSEAPYQGAIYQFIVTQLQRRLMMLEIFFYAQKSGANELVSCHSERTSVEKNVVASGNLRGWAQL